MPTVIETNQNIVSCTRCPRLRDYCQSVAKEKRRAFLQWDYWGRPVPNFGDSKARLLIVGLAPAAHGGNRTGRMFTGDQSGVWLYRALQRAGFANQGHSENINDGLVLSDCLITAACHCAPPDNKPLPSEIENCYEWLVQTFSAVPAKVILALGQIAWNAIFEHLKKQKLWNGAKPKFFHGAKVQLSNGQVVIGSFHPSQQNTFTGKLTEKKFDDVFALCRSFMI